jgi:hypothetical protein
MLPVGQELETNGRRLTFGPVAASRVRRVLRYVLRGLLGALAVSQLVGDLVAARLAREGS